MAAEKAQKDWTTSSEGCEYQCLAMEKYWKQ